LPKTKTTKSPPETTQVDSAKIDVLRVSLEKKRKELQDLYAHDVRVGQESSDDSADDSVDRANNSFNRELMFSLSDTERRNLILVDEALDRIDRGQFGFCVHCGEAIGLPRLEAVPWARFCIDCQEAHEQAR
jgi:DnaK suppressor protein